MHRRRASLTRRSLVRGSFAVPAMLFLSACGVQPSAEDVPQPTPSPRATSTVATDTVASPTPAVQPSPTQVRTATAVATQPSLSPVAAQATQVREPRPTPACTVGGQPTPSLTEGPYYKPSAPERTSLIEPGMSGTRLVISGHVLTLECQPVAGALLDFWQADDSGQYDNAGFKLRGRLRSDESGFYSVETIVPGLYPGRTRHIHVKVQAPGGRVLTTQLFLPDDSANRGDGIFDPGLVMAVQDSQDGKTATFDFVLG